jgi:hypothetical protein
MLVQHDHGGHSGWEGGVVTSIPRITFGIIVLNGEPFLRYNLRAIYPFAHQIIAVEGASLNAAHIATPDGHSLDGTLATLRAFQAEEDPDNKLRIVTAEDDGQPNGFWPGEKDQQSQAYARRATGDWLWQIDIDEFYQPDDMARVCDFLATHPNSSCVTFNAYHFWGGFDYLVEGGLFMSQNFQGEAWGAYRRVFKWGPGYQYVTHRPPTVADARGRNITPLNKRNLSRVPHGAPVLMYHYTNLFPKQVMPKGAYYASLGQPEVRAKFEAFEHPLNERSALHIYRHYGTYNWLRRFDGRHPPAVGAMIQDLRAGLYAAALRQTDDIERVLHSPRYRIATVVLGQIEWMRMQIGLARTFARNTVARQLAQLLPAALVSRLPKPLRTKVHSLAQEMVFLRNE